MIVGGLSKLRSEMQTNKLLTPILDEGADVQVWNAYLERARKELTEEDDVQHSEVRWYTVAWLYFECYAYRRVIDSVRARCDDFII